jgi:hypothetical protein
MQRFARLLVTLACASCRIESGAGPMRCSDGVCPPGYTCQAEVCVADIDAALADAPRSPDGSTAPGPDAAPGDADGGTPIASCGGPDAFADDFEDGVQDPMWSWSWEEDAATLSETGGHMVVTLPPNVGAGYAGYATGNWIDLRGGRVYVEVPQSIDPASEAEAWLTLRRDGSNRLYVYQNGPSLYFAQRVDGSITDHDEVTYDSSLHRWWSIREQDGRIYWESSTNGIDWDPHGDAPTPWFADAVRVEIAAGMWQAEPSPGNMHIDNFNGGTATGRWCKTASRSDDFEDGQAGVQWAQAFDGACVRNETGGRLTLAPATSSTNYCGYMSGTLFELSDSQMWVEVPETTGTDPSSITFFKVETFGNNFLEIVKTGPDLVFHARVDGAEVPYNEVPYDPTAHRWWRIRAQGQMVYWDTSPDGTTWTERGSGTRPDFDLDRVNVVLGAGVSGTSGSPGTAAFDNYNRLP